MRYERGTRLTWGGVKRAGDSVEEVISRNRGQIGVEFAEGFEARLEACIHMRRNRPMYAPQLHLTIGLRFDR